ncbi:MAG: hypothetical protein Q4Q04_05210 [Methanocorpusculum sp.]|nr:hypothetical protein [Methanocorpusculum sp.]
MNATEEKIEKSSHTACIVLRIARVCVWVLAAALLFIALVSGIIYLGLGGEEFMNAMDGGEMVSDLAGVTGSYSADTVIKLLIVATFSAVVYLGLLLGLLYTAGAFFSATRKALTPFLVENAERIRIMAVLILLASVVPTLMDAVSSLIIGLKPDLFTFSLEGLILSIILFCVGVLFEHGCHLQQEADETL